MKIEIFRLIRSKFSACRKAVLKSVTDLRCATKPLPFMFVNTFHLDIFSLNSDKNYLLLFPSKEYAEYFDLIRSM